MALPDVIVQVLSAPTPQSRPTNTDTAFVAGQASRGWSGLPRVVRSINDYLNYFGARMTTDYLYDWLDTFFNEGGAEAYVQRVFGAGATPAKVELLKSANKVLVVEAGSRGYVEPGKTWSETMKIVVEQPKAGETFKLKVELEGKVVEESPIFTTAQQAIEWAKAFSNYIVLTAGANIASGIPDVLASKALTAGTDGAAVADEDYKLALAKFAKEYGPGQVVLPGQTAESRQLATIAHAVANNRFALLDGKDTSSTAELIAQATALYTAPNSGRRYAQLFAPWDIAPGLTAYSTRTVPPTARAAGQYAAVDKKGNPNVAAAGQNGKARWVLDLSQPAWTDTQREELNANGVTVSRRRFGNAIMTFGLRNLADQFNDVAWAQAQNVRLIMAYVARAQSAMDPFLFAQIDGLGQTLGEVKGALKSIAADFYLKGALFGASPEQAFKINASEALNPPSQLAEGKLVVEAALRVSPAAEQILVRIVKVPVTSNV